jgi:hypothetical protein
MRFRRGARQPEPEPAPTPQPGVAPPAPAPQHPDSLVYELLANVALRDLTVIERILSTISDVERGEQDPERLSLYYALDHDVTRLRRSAENALVLAGAQAPMGRTEPMSLLDVARAAASESADYTRVAVGQLPPVAVGPAVADDLAHTLAELMDNALNVSPTRAKVSVTGSRASGGILVAVEDEGIGIAPERLPDLNTRLTGPLVLDAASARQMGLYVVAHLARRHGIYVQLQSRRHLGSTAVAFLPDRLLLENAATAGTPTAAPWQQAATATAPRPAAADPVAAPHARPKQPAATRAPRGYRHSANGHVGPVQRTGEGLPVRPRPQRTEAGEGSAPPARHAAQPAPQPAAQASPNPYLQQEPFAQPDQYAQPGGGYPQPDPYAQQAAPHADAQPAQPDPYAPQPDPLTQQNPYPGRETGRLQPDPLAQPDRPQLPPRMPGPPATPPPVAPATVDRWAPPSEDRAQPTAFTDQGLPRRTRPSGPRPSPGPARREAKPADPDSVLADLDAFTSGTAEAVGGFPAPGPAPLPPAPVRPPLPPPSGPAVPAPPPPAAAPPPPLTDPAQEEF